MLDATVEVVGGADLVVGDNELVVTVTAADGETTQDYTVLLVVAASTDTSLAVFAVNGSDVVDGDVVELEAGSVEVDVVVEATDPDALVEVVGDSELLVGENELVVTVTAADGETVASYTVILVVAASTDTSLAVFTVNGSDVQLMVTVVELGAWYCLMLMLLLRLLMLMRLLRLLVVRI